MKILHVAYNLGGGLETAIVDYASATSQHEHHLFYSTNPRCEIQRAPVFTSEIRSTPSYRRFVRELRAAVRELEPDVVHAQSSIAGGLCRIGLRRSRGLRIVYTPHCFAFERRDISRPKRLAFWLMEAALAHRGSLIVACSPREARLAARFTTAVEYVPNAARVPHTPARPTVGTPVKAVACGRVAPQKDPALLADCARVAEDRVQFEWVGGGDDHRVEQLRAAGVDVSGWVSREEALDRLAAADAYVHTAQWEGAPMTILEAAALGVPVLARDTPAMRELGCAPLWRTPEELLGLLTDPQALARARENGVQMSRRHSHEAQGRALSRAYGGGRADPAGGPAGGPGAMSGSPGSATGAIAPSDVVGAGAVSRAG